MTFFLWIPYRRHASVGGIHFDAPSDAAAITTVLLSLQTWHDFKSSVGTATCGGGWSGGGIQKSTGVGG